MNTYILYSAEEMHLFTRRNLLSGALSYHARGGSLFSADLPPSLTCDVMVIAVSDASPSVADAVCEEARRRACRRVFLDTEDLTNKAFFALEEELLARGLKVFSPCGAYSPKGVVPVVEGAVTGGLLSELFEDAARKFAEFAVSFSPLYCVTPLPAEHSSFRQLSRREVRSALNCEDTSAFFSPQLHCKYFLSNPARENVFLYLFDDCETLSSKVRLAKKHGASHAFFVNSEISDIQFTP